MLLSVRALIAVALLLLAGLLGVEAHGRFSADLKSARADAVAARAVAASAVASAQETERFAAANDLFISDADIDRRAALSEADKYKRLYNAAKAAAPDTCRTVVIAADSALAAADSALAASERKAMLLELSLSQVRPALAQLLPATVQLSTATLQLEKASRPSLLVRLRPKIGFGGSAGVDVHGKPNVVTGITLSWTF